MGVQLKETLRRLCVEIGWSYAVFWKAIRSHSHMHLVWEDGHCEPGPDSPGMLDLLLKEQEGFFAELRCRAEDRVASLAYKIMTTQVHVVGDGIVGQAAMTGNHRWILSDVISHYGSVPKGFEELNHQFTAGIQTIAIIPVLPHGVVQLGSTQMVMENIEFINHVRSLISGLVCVPQAVVSDVAHKLSSQSIHQNASLAMSTSLNQCGDSDTYINRFSSLHGDTCYRQILQAPYSRSVNQPCSLFTHPYNKMQVNSSEVSSTTTTSTLMPIADFSQPTVHPVVESILHHHSQLESEYVRAQVAFPIPNIRSTMNSMLLDSSSASQQQSQIPSDLLSSELILVKEQLLSRESANKHMPKSRTPQPKFHGCMLSSSPMDSDTVMPSGQSESSNTVKDLEKCSSFPGISTGSFKSQSPVSLSKEVLQVLGSADHSNSREMFSGDSQPRCSTSIQKSQTVPAEGQRKKKYANLFQTLDLKSTQVEVHHPCYEPLPGIPQVGWLSSSNPVQENKRTVSAVSVDNHASAPSSQNIQGIDNSEPLQNLDKKTSTNLVQPTSGNDLFDLLGLRNKSGGFCGSYDDMFIHGDDVNAPELSADVSTCLTQLDMGPVFDASNEEIYSSRLFSESSPDQLLDSVVAQINAAAKDDNVSCRTSLTNISSSINTSSATCGWVSSSKQMHGECVDLSSVVVKPEAAGSNSVISGCRMDKTGEYSQKDSGYKSQTSIWVENGQNTNGSISAPHGKHITEIGKLNRKRPRPGENPRPRPKDRQMIQDRVKELREIVPSGAKCSIDALLEKTIKHMFFLQSVTKHADKLKEVGEPRIVSKEGGLLLKDNFEGGATWAFEVGTQSMVCPIIVEDLNSPRQMLVEMLCEEQGFFLEIADLIRGLGLTILKGVMEARNNKVWARFAVEANRDVTRMEIFLSLVRLLEPPNAGSSTVPQGVESLSVPHNTFHPSSIPTTDLSDCLR